MSAENKTVQENKRNGNGCKLTANFFALLHRWWTSPGIDSEHRDLNGKPSVNNLDDMQVREADERVTVTHLKQLPLAVIC
jgi:hypothetical protein